MPNMRKSLSFVIGGIWGLLFFFVPAFKSGLYGFPLYGSAITSFLLLLALYVVLSTPVFMVYVFVVQKKEKSKIGLNRISLSFAIFMLGFFVSLALYFTFGFIGFSRGEFGL